jgi:hypothetical protein
MQYAVVGTGMVGEASTHTWVRSPLQRQPARKLSTPAGSRIDRLASRPLWRVSQSSSATINS